MPADPITARLVTDADSFAASTAAWLATDPVGTNVIGSTLAAVRSGSVFPGARWVLAVDSRDVVVGAAMHTPPYPLHLPAMPDAVVLAIAHTLHEVRHEVAEVSGSAAAAETFARAWAELTGLRARLALSEGVHVLDRLVPPSGVPGSARTATADDLDLLLRWSAEFAREVRPDGHSPDPALIEHRLAQGRLILWEVSDRDDGHRDDGHRDLAGVARRTGHPVSYAGWHPPAAGFARVGPVYTPPEHRRHGYAAAVTAAATRAALDAGADHVMLFTDLANPTSNGVYARLGYRRVGDAVEWVFSSPSTDDAGPGRTVGTGP